MKMSLLPSRSNLPPVVTPNQPQKKSLEDAFHFLSANRAQVNSHLVSHGCLLLRGFNIRTADDFRRLGSLVLNKFADYTRGASPRKTIERDIYNSTEAPKTFPIPLHCELSYTSSPPNRILFFCQTAPQTDGETPIVDMHTVYNKIDQTIRERFEKKGIKIIQNVPPKATMLSPRSWPEMFSTSDQEEVERICHEKGVQCTWRDEGVLRLVNYRPASIVHPHTGLKVWFNSCHNFHDSWSWELRHHKRRMLAFMLKISEQYRRLSASSEDYPYHCVFGDGTEIPISYIEHIREVLWENSAHFQWCNGDLLILDNLRVGHGRMPYRGPRRILVAMGNA